LPPSPRSGGSGRTTAGHVDWRITRLLLAGSMPAALATIALMHFTGITKGWASALTFSLGIALLLTAVTVAYRRPGTRWACAWNAGCPSAASRR
jgi:ABC-type nickel/cobalt efflux system permease component RcnA